MTITFDDDPAVAHTHVFIIGVGRYPYLLGGDKEPIPEFELAANLNQLSSPPRSAESFYQAVVQLNERNNWTRPLGSIELLVSPLPGQQILEGVAYEPATMQNIEDAYWRWKHRCNSSRDNVALFFFCGHGYEKNGHHLMAEDFGHDKRKRWANSFPIDIIRSAFHKCRAHTQLFFVDACRQTTWEMLTDHINPNVFDTPNVFDPPCRFNLTQQAATHLQEAFGQEDQPSYYTKALIKALQGKVATNHTGEWTVLTGAISGNINQLLKDELETEGYQQRCDTRVSDSAEIIKLSEPPLVNFAIECTPKEAESLAVLHYEEMGGNTKDHQKPPGPWKIEVPAGIYTLDAIFNCGTYQNAKTHASVFPPLSIKKITCNA